MSSSPPAPDPLGEPEPPVPAQPGPAPSAPAAHAAGRVWCLALCAGLLGGLLGWLGGEAVYKEYPLIQFRMGEEARYSSEIGAQRALVANDTTVAFAFQGGTLGLALGAAGGLARRSLARAGGAGLLGAAVTGAACALAARLLIPLHARYFGTSDDEILMPLLFHAGLWVTAGALGGLAFGFGLGGWRHLLRALAGGIAGGALGAVAYELLGAVLFPIDHTGELISTSWASRLFARVLVAVLASIGIALAVADPRHKPAPSTNPDTA